MNASAALAALIPAGAFAFCFTRSTKARRANPVALVLVVLVFVAAYLAVAYTTPRRGEPAREAAAPGLGPDVPGRQPPAPPQPAPEQPAPKPADNLGDAEKKEEEEAEREAEEAASGDEGDDPDAPDGNNVAGDVGADPAPAPAAPAALAADGPPLPSPFPASRYLVMVPDRNHFQVRQMTGQKEPGWASYEEVGAALKVNDTGNVGNFVWQYGAYARLPDFRATRTCNVSRAKCANTGAAAADIDGVVEYRPVSNFFNAQRGNDFGYENMLLGKHNTAPLFVGIGMQDYFNADPDLHDLIAGQKITTRAENFRFRPGAMGVLKKLQARRFPMFVRGDYTRNATRVAGFQYAISNGCPSLFISREVRLGRVLAPKYAALKGRIGDRSLKVAINIKWKPRFTQMFTWLLDHYPNSAVYAQGTGDFRSLRQAGVPFERVRFFTTVDAWRESLRGMDVSFGGRIHGNMAALSVGLPVFVVAPDHRVLELAQRMLLPHTTIYGDDLDVRDVDVADVMTRTPFDGDAFDRNRCGIAQNYARVFGRYGIGVQTHVREIAALC